MSLTTEAVTDRITVAEVVKQALRGITSLSVNHEPTAADMSNGILHLRTVLSEVQGKSARLGAVTFYTLQCVADQDTPYSLPDAALDVVGDARWADSTQGTPADTELTVTQIGRSAYEGQQSKDSTGTPLMFYVHKGDGYPFKVYFWPWPSEAGTVRFQCKRRNIGDITSDDALDMEEHWIGYVVKRLAWWLAPSKAVPLEERRVLLIESEALLRTAKRASNPGLDVQMRPAGRFR